MYKTWLAKVFMCVVKDPKPNFERGSFKYNGKITYVYPFEYLLKK